MDRLMRAVLCAVIVVASLSFSIAPASAHEAKTVNGYRYLVGFGDEPAYAGLKNVVQFFLSKDGQPVTDLGKQLTLTASTGSQSIILPLLPSFDPDSGLGTKGEYDAFFIPTAPGAYTFTLTGNLGGPVKASFTSGPDTFSAVVDPGAIEFPQKTPTNLELAQRLQQQTPRIDASITAAKEHADSRAATAIAIAVVAVVLGLIGIALGTLGMRRKS
jgi:hypothetical protein